MNYQEEKRKELIREMVGETRDKVILDLGTTDTQLTKGLKAKKIMRLDAIGSPDILCDLNEKIPLESNSVDIIIAGEIIEHIQETRLFLGECRRVLKKNGIMVLSTPNSCSFKDRVRMVFGKLPLQCAKFQRTGTDKFISHVRDFNFKELNLAIQLSGLVIIRAETNGISFNARKVFPLEYTPLTFGEHFIVKIKVGEKRGFR